MGEDTGRKMMTVQDVAKALGLTRQGVYQLMRDAGVAAAAPGGPGRGKGQRLTAQDVARIQQHRARRLEERAGELHRQARELQAGLAELR